MSNKYNDIIREHRHENELCQICGKELDWPAKMANMAVRYGRNDICKECRKIEWVESLRSKDSTLKTQ